MKPASSQNKTYLFEEMPIPNAVMALCIPTIISSLVTVVYSLVDTLFVGMLGDPVQNAAVTLAGPVLLAFNAVNNLFGVGSSSMMSRALGRKEEETVRRSSATGFYSAMICAVCFSVFCTIFKAPLLTLLGSTDATREATNSYMFWTVTCGSVPAILNVVMAYMVRAEGYSLHASVGTMSGCILNMILDPIFILPWGLDMGAAGAGCATFLSNCVAMAYFLVLLLVIRRGKSLVCLNPAKFTVDREILPGIAAVGIPAAIQNLLNVVGMTILNNFASGYTENVVAAMGIAQKVNMVPMYVAFGISQGIMPLVSYNYASGNSSRMKNTIKFTLSISVCFVTAMAGLFLIFSHSLVALFIDNEVVVDYGAAFLRRFCLGLPFMTLDFTAVGVFQACGKGTYSLLFALLRKIALEIPAIFILNALFQMYGLPMAQPVAEFILAIAALILLGKLIRNVEKMHRNKGMQE